MRPGPPAQPGLTADDFFALVETSLTVPMAALGYHRIHASINDQPSSRSILTAQTAHAEDVPFLWFEFGYEADSDEVCRLVGPDDPQSQEEWWVGYEPASGRLELDAWYPVAGGRVDWDLWRDDGPCQPAEVRRRLAAVGDAITAFVAARRVSPETS